MPSKYRPQLFGWIDDLDKGPRYVTSTDERLLYANDNYCAFIRKTLGNQLLYLLLSLLSLLMLVAAIIFVTLLIISLMTPPPDNGMLALSIFMLFMSLITIYLIIPEFYQNLFAKRGEPIIFNRKTEKVYINESYFFNFKFWRNPLMFLLPVKRRIKEYDWADLHGIVVHNYSRNALTTTIMMVCKPGTHQTIDHIMLDPARSGIGSTFVWAWINSFISYSSSVNLNNGRYLTTQEDKFNRNYIKGQGWPQWMQEAFNARSLDELAQIKQKHGIKE
ncbi:hypothetical protein RHO12_01180 [Orbus sturtevantii]|uniref:DUF6708 domain-containing protein n=1 Tax=Orbus sturtevantii TaxID=3074109 RepID=UPI00370D711E